MVNLMNSLSTASQSLDAQQFGLDVTGQNIANVNTAGYTKRSVDLVETTMPGGASDGGVTIAGSTAQRDSFLEARLRSLQSPLALDGAVSDSLSIVQTSLGSAGSSLDASFAAFFQSFAALAQDATSATSRTGVVSTGQQLAGQFNSLAAQFSASRQQADAQVRGGVNQINTLAAQIASLNGTIASANGADVNSLRDQRDVALSSLAKLSNIGVMTRPDGAVDVTIGNGRALVVGATSYALTATSTPPNGETSVGINGLDITGELTGGQMGGWLNVRDTLIPGYQAQLDQLAFTTVQQVNAAHQAGTDANGNTGNNFFTPLATASGAAAAIAVDPALAADSSRTAASSTGTAGDNQTAKAIAALGDAHIASGGTATLTQGWSQLVYQVGSDAQTAQSNQQAHQSVLSAVQQLRDSVSGVSLDDEATALMTFQRGYQANAKYFSTVNTILDVLMGMAGVTLS